MELLHLMHAQSSLRQWNKINRSFKKVAADLCGVNRKTTLLWTVTTVYARVPRWVFCFCTGHHQHPEGSGCFHVSAQASEATNHSQIHAETPLLSVLGNQASFWCAPSCICTGLLPHLNFLVCNQCSLLDAANIDFIGPFTTLDCSCDWFLTILDLWPLVLGTLVRPLFLSFLSTFMSSCYLVIPLLLGREWVCVVQELALIRN